MRSVALDLGVKETSFCEVSRGLVVARRTVRELKELKDLLGPTTSRARIAIEACREAWHVHDTLTKWGHEVVLVDNVGLRDDDGQEPLLRLLARTPLQLGAPPDQRALPHPVPTRDLRGVAVLRKLLEALSPPHRFMSCHARHST